jgi:hypothetical protein
MEYGSVIWDPYTKQEITKLESIQRRGARFITKDYKRKTRKVREFGLYFSRSGKGLEFHRNRENPGENPEFYRRSRFICSTKSFWLCGLMPN